MREGRRGEESRTRGSSYLYSTERICGRVSKARSARWRSVGRDESCGMTLCAIHRAAKRKVEDARSREWLHPSSVAIGWTVCLGKHRGDRLWALRLAVAMFNQYAATHLIEVLPKTTINSSHRKQHHQARARRKTDLISPAPDAWCQLLLG